MTYQASTVGNEISCVMFGVSSSVLTNTERLEKELLTALKRDAFTILNVSSHTFDPQGFTLAVLLSESHAVIHTYPEYNSLYFNIYSCRGKDDGINVLEYLKKYVQPSHVSVFSRHIPVVQVIKSAL